MIKVYCDFCEKELEQGNFACDISKVQVIDNLVNGQKQQVKNTYQICQVCFDKIINPKICTK